MGRIWTEIGACDYSAKGLANSRIAMWNEINELILSVLELYKKRRVDGDAPEVAMIADRLMAFAVRHSLENEISQLRKAHLPTRHNQIMTVEDANVIIKYLLSLQSRMAEDLAGLKALIHPAILNIAESRMESGHYADAVESAFKAINNAVKEKVRSRLDRELDGQKLMQRAFAPDNPILLVEGNLDTQTNRDTQSGYMMMLAGAISAIRNPKAHENMCIGKEDAIRKLIFASMLMYKLDAAQLAPEQ